MERILNYKVSENDAGKTIEVFLKEKGSLCAASITLVTAMSTRLSPSRMMGQRIPLEIVPTFLSILNTSYFPVVV